MPKDKCDYVHIEISREARNQIKHLWILIAPEKEQRKFISDFINKAYKAKRSK